MSSLAPRIVLVHRPSEYQALLASHGTRGQAAFFLESRGQDIGAVEQAHQALAGVLAATRAVVPPDWGLAEVARDDLDRFLFSDNDIVVAVGQDGLIANLAKYCSDRPVLGVAAGASQGVLTRLGTDDLPGLFDAIHRNAARLERRTMVAADLGQGQTLLALNELFIGHRSHQSARYLVQMGDATEFQSSSGVIVTTGTGATGWSKSIMTATGQSFALDPMAPTAAFFAREPWPSLQSGTQISAGQFSLGQSLEITSRMDTGGVIFADGIEQDFMRFDWGTQASINIADRGLNLVAKPD